ncbi:MAG: hypothetical protein JW928_05425, partial [Candidatus Aureabacteria bacterium]|nr:hypothetical protein [Candidatus Auribacterota bacterium]
MTDVRKQKTEKNSGSRIKIMHLTTDSQLGGTEKMILAFLKNSSGRFQNSLIILKGDGALSQAAREYNIKTYALGIKHIGHIWKLCRLYKILKQERPHVLQSYLFHANIAARIIGSLAGIRHIISGQRNIDAWRKWHHTLIDRITSPLAESIISNTEAG